MYKIIKRDMFNISKRIKQIDKDYFILFNYKTGKYEVHNKSQYDSTFCLSCPYEKLDSRLLNYVLRTSVKNSKILFDEMDYHNYKIEKEIEDKRYDYIDTNLKDIYFYASNSSKAINILNNKNTKWL